MLRDWHDAGLVKPSLIKPLIATVAQQYIIKHLGSLSNIDRENWLRNATAFETNYRLTFSKHRKLADTG